MVWVGGGVGWGKGESNISMDQDSESLAIELPVGERARHTALMATYEFISNMEEPGCLKFYLVVNDVYLRNLIARKEEPSLSDEQKRRLGPTCLLVHSFQFGWLTHDGCSDNIEEYRAELSLHYLQYKGLEVRFSLGELERAEGDFFMAKLHYCQVGESEVRGKTFHLSTDGQEAGWQAFMVSEPDIETYLRPKLAIEFTYRQEPPLERSFLGIKNEGNTCYMNSVLQILFYIRPLRRLVFDYAGTNNILKVLRDIFVDLMDRDTGPSRKSVEAEALIQAYGRFAERPLRQQDIHEFLLGFLEELENQCPELRELWIGSGKQLLTSKEVDKPYRSEVTEDFSEVDVQLEDHRGNTYGQVIDSLRGLLEEEKVDDRIETDEYGKVAVTKSREFHSLPNILFLNLKRYQYKKERQRVIKVLADLRYPSRLNLGFLLATPTGHDHDYLLYALAVHRGQTYNSGHYYAYVNTGPDPQRPHWCQFNDSLVSPASEQSALSFTGGKKRTIAWNSQYERWIEKEYICEDTAYLLVYIRADKFEEYQITPTPLPPALITKKRQIQAQAENVPTINVEVAIAIEDIDPFEAGQTMTLPLRAEESAVSQISKMDHIFGEKVHSVWKVNRSTRKIKQLVDYSDLPQTPARLFNYKRGHRIPDYLLVVTSAFPCFLREEEAIARSDRYGLVRILEDGNGKMMVTGKGHLQELISKEERRREKKGRLGDKECFLYDWNDYCELSFE